MPIRPIDMQVMMPKSQQVSKINQNMFNRGEIALQQGLLDKKKEDEKKLKKVNKNDKKEMDKLLNNKPKVIYNNKSEKDEAKKFYGSTIDIKL